MSKINMIKKRNGEVVAFDAQKIVNAIFKAAKAVGGSDINTAIKIAGKVIERLENSLNGNGGIPDVETIQDIVEKELIEAGHAKTAKAYILYREQHKKIREHKGAFVEVKKIIDEYIKEEDWRVKENSNSDYSFSGLMLHTAGKIIANYTLNEIYTPQIKEAHEKGFFHIHDLSAGIIGYCAGWSLKKLIDEGFGGVPNRINAKPAKHLDVLIAQMVNFIGTMQMEFAGAQAFSSVDTYLAPFVREDNLSYKEVKQNMQRLIFSLNVPSRWGSQAPFSNLTFDIVVPDDLKDEPAVVGGEVLDYTYGDCQKEMDMINKAFLEVMEEGDANGRIFTFPIPTYNITSDFDWDSEISELLFRVTAKYGIPYFQNYIGSGLNPRSIRAMCCRLNLDLNELQSRPGGMWGPGDATGSIGVVTINVNRLAILSKTKKEFFSLLERYMDIARDSLEIKRKIIVKNMENGLMPYTKRYLGTFDNHFSTIGLVGMNEACQNLLGQGIASEKGKAFAIETLSFMRERLKEYQKESGNLYNLEASPAESAAYRLAMLDKKYYPDAYLSGSDEVPYLTNSTQLNVDETTDIFEALEHQNDIQPLYTGGTIFHIFLGEKIANPQTCKNLVRKVAENTKLPYYSITPTFSICKNHGYLNGRQERCPYCGEETEVYSRIVGYFRPVKNWNKGKQTEFDERATFKVEKVRFVKEQTNKQEETTKKTEYITNKHDIKEINKNIKILDKEFEFFFSPNCPKCFSLKKQMEKLNINYIPYNVADKVSMDIAQSINVSSVPTLIIKEGGKELKRINSAGELIKLMKQIA